MRLHSNSIINFSLLFLFFTGCSSYPTLKKRIEYLKTIPKKYHEKTVSKNNIKIIEIYDKPNNCKNINIYIEGDGLSYIYGSVSDNPTPINPVGLKLFLKDTNRCKIYLSRPYQFINNKKANKRLWSELRYSNLTVNFYINVLNEIKRKYNDKSFTLIGYSGGGTIAALIASKRNDIKKLILIASNLDLKKWYEIHYLKPSKYDLNPADFSKRLEKIKQIIIIGQNDKNVNYKVIKSYLSHFKNKKNIKVLIIQNMKHNDKWDEFWKKEEKKILN
jgi:hypothetical protein